MSAKKQIKKAVKVRDLKPKKIAKDGATKMQAKSSARSLPMASFGNPPGDS